MAAPCTAVAAAALAPDNTAISPSISTSSPEISTSTAGRNFKRTIYDQQVMFRLRELSNLCKLCKPGDVDQSAHPRSATLFGSSGFQSSDNSRAAGAVIGGGAIESGNTVTAADSRRG